MATMADLDELALAMPQTTKELSDDGRPTYLVHGKFFCFHRSRRRDAIDPDTGERLDDVLVFRVADLGVKELMLADERRIFFTTPHWEGYSAVLMRIPDLARLDREELEDAVVEGWLTRAQKRVAKAWLDEHRLPDDYEFSRSSARSPFSTMSPSVKRIVCRAIRHFGVRRIRNSRSMPKCLNSSLWAFTTIAFA